MDGVMGMQMAQFQTNYTFALMKMSMEDAQNQAAAMVEMMSSVPAPAQYGFDVWA
ncbi:putative motility protein [bacterium 1xD42-67]|nr:putative motility protein [Lawsonibacter sp.]MCI9568048.1 putative motility protein [Lawsonibacter sp.]RKI69126.1 putative motility protein [bacterium 1xD42-67]